MGNLHGLVVKRVWEYKTRELTSAKNITSDGNVIDQTKIANLDVAVSTRSSHSVDDIWNYPSRTLSQSTFPGEFDLVIKDWIGTYVIPEGMYYAVMHNKHYNGTITVRLQHYEEDSETWITIKSVSVDKGYTEEVGVIVSDGSNLRFYAGGATGAKAYLFRYR